MRLHVQEIELYRPVVTGVTGTPGYEFSLDAGITWVAASDMMDGSPVLLCAGPNALPAHVTARGAVTVAADCRPLLRILGNPEDLVMEGPRIQIWS